MSINKNVTIVDYGYGNIWSVVSALEFLGARPVISSSPADILKSESILLPGVGCFRAAMESLIEKNLDDVIKEAVQVKKRKILGICLGFQMLAASSSENGMTSGLGLIPGPVKAFSNLELEGRKLPHIGFNQVNLPNSSALFDGFTGAEDFYFVHSYRILPSSLSGKKATCNYGVNFVAAYENNNVYGVQFHPEKSQTNGLKLLNNFLSI